MTTQPLAVIPAKAGIMLLHHVAEAKWIPASAAMASMGVGLFA
jgi:hypothetical protein